MKQEDWQEVLTITQKRLYDLGRKDLADIDRYKRMYERELDSSRSACEPMEKYLALKMLGAVYTDLYAGSPNLVNASIKNIGKIIKEGDRPREVHVQTNSNEETSDSYTRLGGRGEVSYALSDLRKMIRVLRSSSQREGRG